MTTAAPITLPQEILTPRLILRAASVDFAPHLHAAVHATWPQLDQWAPWAIDKDAQTLDFVQGLLQEKVESIPKRGPHLHYYAFTRDTGEYVLIRELNLINWRIPSACFGGWTHAAHQGKGYMTEAMNAMTRLCFEGLGMKRIEMRVGKENAPSLAVVRKLGFIEEGLHPSSSTQGNGHVIDMYSFARFNAAGLPPLEVTWR